jgi:RNA polymerase sigma factor (sigma-70 family)
VSRPPESFPLTTANLRAELDSPDPEARRRVMEILARRYWRPVHLFLARSHGKGDEEARDLTQTFFSWLLERDLLLRFDSTRSTFRTFLKGVLRNFAGNELQAVRRLKRGGGVVLMPLESAAGVELEDAAETPDVLFDRAFARDLLARAVERVRQRHQAARRLIPFITFEQRDLSPDAEPPSYAELAARLGVSQADVRNHLADVRAQVREEVRAELADVEGDGAESADEAIIDWQRVFRSG